MGAALGGFLVGALLVLGFQGVGEGSSNRRLEPAALEPIEVVEPIADEGGSLLLAWTRDGLRAGIERVLTRMEDVEQVTTVDAGLAWIRRTVAADGTVVDDPPGRSALPVEIAFVDASSYAPFVPPSERRSILDLRAGEALLSQTSAALREADVGMRIGLQDGDTLTVRGVLSDTAAAGYEIVTPKTRTATHNEVDRFALMRLGVDADRRAIEDGVRAAMPPGTAVRLRAEGETPFLRYGDAVLPLGSIKATFGEFAARDLGTGFIDIQQAWVKDNIRTARVPLLDTVTCHRTLFPQLRAVLQQVRAEGLEFLINPEQFGGCYSPRYVDRIAGGRLSHHAWGIGIDVNVAENAFGTAPDQDTRLVKIFENHGFTWGGRWLVPDGMHFEWVRFT